MLAELLGTFFEVLEKFAEFLRQISELFGSFYELSVKFTELPAKLIKS